jgi:YHS domain-containing protein
MEENQTLSAKILSCIERHQHELSEQQKLTDGTMKELLGKREQFAAVAGRIMDSVIHPRLEELKKHFDNAAISDWHGDSDFHSECKFTHTPRFPATVSFDICLLLVENSTGLKVRYDLEIRPALMEYKQDEEKDFPLDGSDEAIGLWVEEKIVGFIDTYLRLETNPFYQKENFVMDPVCGMQISAIAATLKIELTGQSYYFCSEVCKEAFLAKRK